MFSTLKAEFRDWIRWALFFSLLSVGVALINGFADMTRDPSPIVFMLGFMLFQIFLFVFPGIIIGGMVALASKRNALGVKIMIAVNSVIVLLFMWGMFLSGSR